MKILIVGDNLWDIYEKAFYKAFKELGYNAEVFGYGDRFKHNLWHKIENKFVYGVLVNRINTDLVEKVKNYQPNLIFFYRVRHIYPDTIKKIKQQFSQIKLFAYNNDDPFAKYYPSYYWRHYKNSLKYMDWIFSYRWKNIDDYQSLGYDNISLLRSYYLKEKNYCIEDISKKYDIIFVGHWENDNRDEIIKYLLDNGIKVQLFGTLWEKSKYYDYFINIMQEIKPLYSEEYNQTINESKIALVFLSKLNNDTYTRRCFEIPITKTMMVSEYTDDLANNLFEENKEAVYFTNKEELLQKIETYLNDEKKRQQIIENGYKRLMKDGHEVIDRCKEVFMKYEEIIK